MIYFEKPGPKNTEETLRAALERAREADIRTLVVASSSGRTAEALVGCGFHICVVTHQAGYKDRASQELTPDMRARLQAAKFDVLTTTHLLGGVDRALNYKWQGMYPAELIAHSLRMLGQGYKVAVEISSMAMDAGFITAEEDVIAIGGTGRGADCAVLLHPAHSQYIFDTNVKEIICMPRGHRAAQQ